MLQLSKLTSVVLLLLLPFYLEAQWQITDGPYGGNAKNFAAINDTIFVNGTLAGIFRSDDFGATWKNLYPSLPIPSEIINIKSDKGNLFASLRDGNTCYGMGMYMSADKGETWIPKNAGISYTSLTDFIFHEEEIFAAKAGGGVYYSPDYGATWQYKKNELPSKEIYGLVYFDSKIFVGSDKLYVSDNYGDSWTTIDIPGLNVNGIRNMVSTDSVIYVADMGDLYISFDTAQTWQAVNLHSYSTITSLNRAGDSVYLTNYNGTIYSSSDNFSTWDIYTNSLASKFPNDAMIHSSGFYMATSQGIYKSENGNDWSTANTGFSQIYTRSLAAVDSSVFLGSSSLGVCISEDNGDNWAQRDNGLTATSSTFIHDIEVVNNKILIATGHGLYKSLDTGLTWIQKPIQGLTNGIGALAYDDGTLIAAMHGEGIFASDDLGENWSKLSTGIITPDIFYDMDISGDTVVLLGSREEITISTDGGINWTDITISPATALLNNIRILDNSIYACDLSGLYKSDDLGITWISDNEGLSGNALKTNDIIAYNNKQYLATKDGTYVRNKKRSTWHPVNEGLVDRFILELAINDTYCFAGTTSEMWRRSLLDLNLQPIINSELDDITCFEDSIIEINLEHFNVTDNDDVYPEEFTLTLLEGDNYTVRDDSIIPDPDFYGTLTVPVYVEDAMEASPVYYMEIEVLPVNDIPQITGINRNFSIPEDSVLDFSITYLNVEDIDNNFPADFTLMLQDGDNYSVRDSTIIPYPDFYGNLEVHLSVSDGIDMSQPYIYELAILPVNDAPVITGTIGEYSVLRDSALVFSINELIVEDPDNNFPSDFTMMILDGANYSVKDTLIQPDAGLTGDLMASVVVSDGQLESDSYSFTIEVYTVNHTQQTQLSTISIFPNPVEDYVEIDGNTQPDKIEVIDISGKLVKTFHNECLLNLSNINKGLYILKIYSENDITSVKMLKN